MSDLSSVFFPLSRGEFSHPSRKWTKALRNLGDATVAARASRGRDAQRERKRVCGLVLPRSHHTSLMSSCGGQLPEVSPCTTAPLHSECRQHPAKSLRNVYESPLRSNRTTRCLQKKERKHVVIYHPFLNNIIFPFFEVQGLSI